MTPPYAGDRFKDNKNAALAGGVSRQSLVQLVLATLIGFKVANLLLQSRRSPIRAIRSYYVAGFGAMRE